MLKFTKLKLWTLEIEKVGGIWQDTDEVYMTVQKLKVPGFPQSGEIRNKSTPHHLIPGAAFSVEVPHLSPGWMNATNT